MKKRSASLFLIILLVCFLTPSSLPAGIEPDLAGHWEGIIDIPGMKLDIDIDFSQKADGTWEGDISIPAQNAKDLPLINISFKDNQAVFTISGVPGEPVFKGTISDDGQTLSGDFTQGGQSFPFTLKREASPAIKAKKALEGFEDEVDKALETFMVPGLAIAVVINDEVILAKGFGYRDVENKVPVTADTLMAIGSSSKAFTTFALGILADQGKMEWDLPVRNYIPWFKLYDQDRSEHLTPRDMVTHRSGLPRHDLVWYNNFTSSREDLVRKLAYLQPTADLREKWQYNNLMFLTAGYLLETLTEKPWEDAVRTLVFKPLGMKRSNFSVKDSQKDSNYALPYREKDKKLEKIPFRDITTVGPAGSINSSVNEMANWVIVHLNNGKLQGNQILNPATVVDMHLVHMPTGQTPDRPEISPAGYGMGWFVDSYRGFSRFHHGGNIDGFSAMVSMLPQKGLGFVVLANKNGTGVPELLIRHATDLILGLDHIDWLGEAAENRKKGQEEGEKAEEKKFSRRKPGTKPAHKLEDYAGDYFHPGYGNLEIMLKDGMLSFQFNGITTPLSHWHYETFNGEEVDDPTFTDMKLTFHTDVNGNVAEFVAPFEPTADDIVFSKKPSDYLSDPAYLKQLTGKYQLINQVITVNLKGNSLTLYVPGSPVLDLVPDLGDEFYIKQAKIARLRFIKDKKGEFSVVELIQPNGIFEAKRMKE